MAENHRERIGRLLVIGGNEDPDEEQMRILPHLVEIAGGKRARILVCSAPSAEPEKTARSYRELLERLGAAEVHEAPITGRAEANAPALLKAVERCTAVLFTGGDQLRLTSVVAGTELSTNVRRRLFEEELVVAGTSAGAAAMSGTMIIRGAEGGTVRRADVSLAPGLGYWRDTVVDTHFNQRGRVHRLLTVFAQNPQVLGIGIDEDTAIDLLPGTRFTVLGSGAVTVFDGRVTHSNAAEVEEETVLALTDSALHVLPDGYGFDLRTRRPLLPDGREIAHGE